MEDTIFALATAPGRGAVAVVRLSGSGARSMLETVCGSIPAPRRASLRRLTHGGEVLDEALVLWFPGPASFTGEDSAEFHLHGGRAGVEAVSQALGDLGARLAEPGEFSRRAFQNGKLDLTQAEAIADLVEAETAAQRRQALGQLGGGLTARYAAWRLRLVQALARLEAAVDFPDEDLPESLTMQVGGRIEDLAHDMEAALADEGRGERVREGYRVALIGAPNAGKSSLFNRLVGRDAAIVTDRPGTTRDVIEAPAIVDGFRVLYADTAGIHETDDLIEAEGVRRALDWAASADLRLWVIDGSSAQSPAAVELVRRGDIVVINKADLPPGAGCVGARGMAEATDLACIEASAERGDGLDHLEAALTQKVANLSGQDFPAVTRQRHRRHLQEAVGCLRRAFAVLGQSPELAAEDLRHAALALGRIAGRVDTEQVLDEVFAHFCIGK